MARSPKLVNFGAFVRVEEGLEGLIHISELSHQRVAHPGDVVQEGQQVKLRIISLDSERHRLGLSLKQAEDRPAPAPREDRQSGAIAQRRDRFDYRPGGRHAEPEGGIDSTMAAASQSSGLARAVPHGRTPRTRRRRRSSPWSDEAATATADGDLSDRDGGGGGHRGRACRRLGRHEPRPRRRMRRTPKRSRPLPTRSLPRRSRQTAEAGDTEAEPAGARRRAAEAEPEDAKA